MLFPADQKPILDERDPSAVLPRLAFVIEKYTLKEFVVFIEYRIKAFFFLLPPPTFSVAICVLSLSLSLALFDSNWVRFVR